MKTHTQEYKDKIKELGRELDSKITYELEEETIELGNEELNSITPHYQGAILKSVMKQLDIDSNVDIPIGTEVNYQFGLKLRSGKNLYDKNNEQKVIIDSNNTERYGVIVEAPNQKVSVSGTFTGDIYYKYLTNGTYSNYSSFNNNSTFSVTEKIIFYAGGTSKLSDVATNLQIEISDTPTPYEEFGAYDYLDYGNYIVYSSEKQEDVNSYKIVAYDKMLYAMKPYEALTDSLGEPITYPITLRNYLIALARRLGLTFKNASDTFVNYDKEIKNELYLTEDGKSLDYTYRDVLDELSQATASSICISNDDELEVRYVNTTSNSLPNEYQEVEYIESSGTQYIDLPFGFDKTDIIDAKFSVYHNTYGDKYIVAPTTWNSSGANRFGLGVHVSSVSANKQVYTMAYGNKTTGLTHLIPYTENDGNIHHWKYKDYLAKIEDLNISINVSPITFDTTTTNLKLFYGYNSNTIGKIAYYKHIKNNVSVCELIPCYRKSDNVIGLYDLVNNVFYTNQGTGSFTKGEDVYDTIDEEYLKDVNVKFGEKFGKVNALVLSRSADSDIIDRRDETSIAQNGLCEIKISDNQILNDDDRDLFIDGIFNKLKGLEYYVNDYTSTGITYYDFLDRYNVKVGDTFYPCIMLNDELEVSQGLVENIHAEAMEQEETDYTKSSKSDKMAIRTEITVNKQQGRIDSIVGSVTNLESDYSDLDSQVQLLGTRVTQTESGVQTAISKATNVEDTINNGVPKVVTGIVTIDFNGIDVGRSDSKVHTKMRNNEFSVGNENSDDKLAFIGYDEIEQKSKAEMDNLKVRNWLNMGTHRVEKLEINGNYRTGHFYDG